MWLATHPSPPASPFRHIPVHVDINQNSIKRDTRAIFISPRVYQVHIPATRRVISPSSAFPSSVPPLDRSTFSRPSMALSLIPPLPALLTSAYKHLFVHPSALAKCPEILLLRLYLGREDLSAQIEQFPEGLSSDLPLNEVRYTLPSSRRSTAGAGSRGCGGADTSSH